VLIPEKSSRKCVYSLSVHVHSTEFARYREQSHVMVRSKATLWAGAFTGSYRPSIEGIRGLDPFSKFLYSARSVILVISAQAAIIAGLLAAGARQFHWLEFMAVLAGFVVAHMISNLSNDYFGFKHGHDVPDSPRMRYTVHPVASGVIPTRTLLTALATLAGIGSAITLFFILERGWLAVTFAVIGMALLLLYDAPPTPIKSIGLGELAVLLVWGPLMVGGGYAMITGHVSLSAFGASIPYGLGVMTILMGKHIDKIAFDSRMRILTLPVLLGERAARLLTIILILLIYGAVGVLIASRYLTPFSAIIVLALPRTVRAVRVISRPRPLAPPAGYVGWPLWYSRVCLQHNRLLGWTYILGLALGAVWPSVSIR
jgi:1,4-dihydroxy-2-naphthoate polyprenyltransferase